LAGEAVKDGAVLGYNFPGDVWYHDAYQLLTSRGLRPAAPPTDYKGPGLPRLLPWGRHRETTVAPPAVDIAAEQAKAPDTTSTEAAGPAATTPNEPAATAAKPTKTKKKKKNNGFVHDVLGL
jgi:outer membrane protein assembly factor BamD